MNKVGNEVVEVPKGIEVNEKDYCTSLLSTLKDMEKNYVIAMTEASNDWLYDQHKSVFTKISKLQRDLYNLMFKKGWYQLEAVDSKKLDEKYNMLDSDYKDLSD